MFRPSMGILREDDWYISTARSTIWVNRCNIQHSELPDVKLNLSYQI